MGFFFLCGSSNFRKTSSLEIGQEVGRVKVVKIVAETSHPEDYTTAIWALESWGFFNSSFIEEKFWQ